MSKVVLYISLSLDGFIARPDGNLDWLETLPNPKQDDYGYPALLESIEALIMGKETYNKVLSFGIEWPYANIDSYIATSDSNFGTSTPKTYTLSTDISQFITDLKAKSKKDIWLVGGGKLITYFLNHELIDEMILTIIPTIIGEGVPLFPNKPKESSWNLKKVEHFESGAVILTYKK